MSAVPVPDPVVEDRRERILLTGDLPSPANPPDRLPVPHPLPVAAGDPLRHRAAPAAPARPRGRPPSHRVACHWAEQIEAGEITPHAVAATATEQRDLSQDKGDFLGPASVTEAL